MYQLTDSADQILRTEDQCQIPRGHRWWDEYETWLADGNQPLPAVELHSSVPEQVTRYQARAALYKAGLLDDVEHYMALPDTDRLLVLAWQDAQVFKRHSPMVIDLGKILGLTTAKIDELFIAAAAIE